MTHDQAETLIEQIVDIKIALEVIANRFEVLNAHVHRLDSSIEQLEIAVANK